VAALTMLWFTSDTHFGHANIIALCRRPFASAAEMDEQLIERWNEAVRPDDTVYHLGDFTLQGSGPFAAYARRLQGRIRVLPGSHDRRWVARLDSCGASSLSGHPVELLPPLVSLKLPELGAGGRPQVLVLCHYALRVWDRSHYGAWHLYGHCHGSLPALGLSFDVGVDAHGFRPWSLDEVAARLREAGRTLGVGDCAPAPTKPPGRLKPRQP
jgi:calcineurin-like phosphoesterase family protein